VQENIILIGYRATGKTSVSQILSEFLSFPVVSTDEVFVKTAGSIDEYVAVHGWDGFRNQESAILHQFHCEETIIDCGGGIIVKESNRKCLKKLGMIFWLQASVETIKERLSGSYYRPPLTQSHSSIDEVSYKLTQRIPLYEECAVHRIATVNKTLEEVSCEIMECYARFTMSKT